MSQLLGGHSSAVIGEVGRMTKEEQYQHLCPEKMYFNWSLKMTINYKLN